MRIKYIIGMLVCIIITTGVALAAGSITLNTDNVNGVGVAAQTITASLDSATTVTFYDAPVGSNPQGWFMGVGIPNGYTVSSVIDSNGNTLADGDWKVNSNSQMDGFGKFVECATTGQNKPTWVRVTYGNGALTTNSVLCAEVAWGTGSCFFKNGEVTSVPEYPSVAMPIAAILGLLFITQRRKEN